MVVNVNEPVVENQPPIADAGADQTVDSEQAGVSLDGSGSTDPDGDPITYSWTQTSGPAVTLSGADTATPSFDAPVGPATLEFELEVCDEEPLCDTDTVVVNVNEPVVGNQPPVADAGADQTVDSEQAGVSLDGSGSTDPDGDPITYSWTQTSGPAVTLSGADTATPSFDAPVGPATLEFELEVCDEEPLCDTDTVVVNVDAPNPDFDGDGILNGVDTEPNTPSAAFDDMDGTSGSIVNRNGLNPTVADATEPDDGVSVTTEAGTGSVELSVCGGFTVNVAADSEVVITCGSVKVEVVSGSAEIDLGGGSTASVPEGGIVQVSDNGSAGSTVENLGDTVVTVTTPDGETTIGPGDSVDVNQPPTANAGPDQTVDSEQAGVTLDGTGSSDPDGDAGLTYSWTQISGPAVTLSGADTATPSFDAPVGPATLEFELEVDDDEASDTDTVVVNVNEPVVEPPVFKNAAKECKAERKEDPDAFKEKYGTNKNGKNAFGKCVSSKRSERYSTDNRR